MKFEDLSQRAKNVCLDNDIYSLDELIEFINEGGKLSSLRNCGKKTIYEFNHLISNNINEGNKLNYSPQNSSELTSLYNSIRDNDLKRDIFYDYFNSHLNNLSVRSKNAYLMIVGNEINPIDSFIQKAILNHISFESLKNVGKKASQELENLRGKIEESLHYHAKQQIDKHDHLLKILETSLGFKFNEIDGSYDNLKNSLKNKQFDLIKFFDSYIINHFVEREVDKLLLIMFLSEDNEVFSLDKISKKVGLSRERVRQISVNNLKSRTFTFLSNLLFYCEGLSNDIEHEYFSKVRLRREKIEKKLNLNYLTYNSSTLTKIISFITNDFSVIYSGEQLEAINRGHNIYSRDFYTKNRVLKSNYIFSKEFINKEFCLEILNDFLDRNCKKVQHNYYYNPFLKFNLSGKQKEFLINLITENFNCDYTEDGFLIKRNTVITLDEIVENVLLEEDKPLLLSEIYHRLDKRHPGKCKSEEALRGTIGRLKEKFIHLRGATTEGKTLYGLKKWENTKELKSGSIKQLCIDYLNNKKNPVHLLELSRFIIKHRKTTSRNILTNLKFDPHNNFIFLKSSFIGLAKKKYNKKFIDSIKSLGGPGGSRIMEFLKNNIYYNYDATVSKFSNELKCFPIQVEQTIINGIDNGVLRKKAENIYYNSIQEDSIINDLFISEDEINILGYNPYRVSIEDKKVVIRIKQSLNNNVNLKDSDFQNDGFYGGGYFSPARCLIVYNPSMNRYKAYLWLNEIKIEEINMNFKFNIENDFAVIKVSSQTNIVDFTRNKSKKFISLLKILLESNMKYEDFIIDGKSIKMEYLDLEGLSELNAISKITNEVFEKYNVELEISESREIYQRIKIAKN